MAGKFDSTQQLLELVRHAESDAWLSLGLAFYLNVLPLSRQLSCLSGAPWSRVLQVCLQLPLRKKSNSFGFFQLNATLHMLAGLRCSEVPSDCVVL